MQKLLFFSRVALICNICFLVTVLLRYVPFLANGMTSSTLIVMGTIVSILINSLLVVVCILLLIARLPITIPPWLIVTNLLIFVLQVIFLIQ